MIIITFKKSTIIVDDNNYIDDNDYIKKIFKNIDDNNYIKKIDDNN